MRRYTSFHSQAYALLSYWSKDGEILTGSLPARTWREAAEMFTPFEAPHGSGLVHFTLSMPAGHSLPDAIWFDVIDHVMAESGLPTNLVPWVAWGGEHTNCEHIHIASACETFLGRELELQTSLKATDRLERDLRQRLSLPELPWRPEPALVLAPTISMRNRVKHGQVGWFASDLNAAMRKQRPSSLANLNLALEENGSAWRVMTSPERADRLIPTNQLTGRSCNPRRAGAAFRSSLILPRFALAARLRAVAFSFFLHRVADYVRDAFPTFLQTQGIQHERASIGPQPEPHQNRQNEGGCSETASTLTASRPSPRGADIGIRRAPLEPASRTSKRTGRQQPHPGSYWSDPGRLESSLSPTGAKHRVSSGRGRSRARRVIEIYHAARRVGIKVKHRFGSNQTAVLVSGPHGELVIHEMVDGAIIENEENPCSGWAQFVCELEQIPGCWKRELGTTSDNDVPTVF